MVAALKNPKVYRKAVAALIACLVLAVARGLLPADVKTWLDVLSPLLIALGVYAAPANDEPKGDA